VPETSTSDELAAQGTQSSISGFKCIVLRKKIIFI